MHSLGVGTVLAGGGMLRIFALIAIAAGACLALPQNQRKESRGTPEQEQNPKQRAITRAATGDFNA